MLSTSSGSLAHTFLNRLMILESPLAREWPSSCQHRFRIAVLNCPWEKSLGHCTGEELILLLDDENKRVDKQEIDIVTAEDGALARIYGRIDIDSSPALRTQLLTLFESPHPNRVSIDLSEVSHIDSSGVATLIDVLKIARGHQTELGLQGLHGRLLRLFESTGILSLFNGSTRE